MSNNLKFSIAVLALNLFRNFNMGLVIQEVHFLHHIIFTVMELLSGKSATMCKKAKCIVLKDLHSKFVFIHFS